MSEWHFISENRIQHTCGFELILNSGSWSDPHDIRPYMPKNLVLQPLDMVRKLREGLNYASSNITANTL